jgi:hypothetical protein
MLLAGCAAGARLPALSTVDREANAVVIADFVNRLCVEAGTSRSQFVEALRDTGWRYRQMQAADATNPLDVWQLPHAMLVHSGRPIVARAARVWTCTFVTDAAVSPSRNSMSATLRARAAGTGEIESDHGELNWRPALFTQVNLALGAGTQAGSLGINVEYAQLTPLHAWFGK